MVLYPTRTSAIAVASSATSAAAMCNVRCLEQVNGLTIPSGEDNLGVNRASAGEMIFSLLRSTAAPLALCGALTPWHAKFAMAIEAACKHYDLGYFSMPVDGGGVLHFYSSLATPAEGPSLALHAPTHVLVAMHGHPRDANKTFDAAMCAVTRGDLADDTLVVAPLFQVPSDENEYCKTEGTPEARDDDLLWTCSSWIDGESSRNFSKRSSYAAIDSFLAGLKKSWPSLTDVTLSGFSAGAQMVQHSIGFAVDVPGLRVHYVVADPGSWLYFDKERLQPQLKGKPVDWSECIATIGPFGDCTFTLAVLPETCHNHYNNWKYGLAGGVPELLRRSPEDAKEHYAKADIAYMEGALDTSTGGILDPSCPAELQGLNRLQRGLGYAVYDRVAVAPANQRTVTVIEGCAHDVACVFPSPEARQILLGR
jgi:hypothetical protein